MMEITPGFVPQCLLPQAEQYVTVSLSSCLAVSDRDVGVSKIVTIQLY